MAKKQFDADGHEIAEPSPKTVRFKFLKFWSSDRGVFQPGDEADLPIDIAEGLVIEDMGDTL
jgi:hypothetical protein